MKSVLLVDDEKNFLLSLAEMLKDSEDEFSIKTAICRKWTDSS